jgi:ribA/ribD-fused uncharacterized protein
MIIDRFTGRWAFLCNFHPAPLTWEGQVYPTSEHAFNAGKTTDWLLRHYISNVPTPGAAKKAAKLLPLRPGWNIEVRYDVMWAVLWAKFSCQQRRIDALLSTGDAYLIEGTTWHDNHWGNCTCLRPACTTTTGLNHLGSMLMDLRDIFREQR